MKSLGQDDVTAEPMTVFNRPLKHRAGVPDHYIDAINDFIALGGDVKGLRVLSIAGVVLPRELVLGELGAARWLTVVDPDPVRPAREHTADLSASSDAGAEPAHDRVASQDEPYAIFEGSVEQLPSTLDGQFDLVLSLYSLQHLRPLDSVLDRLHAVLRPGGTLFAQFGPIWSCDIGSLFWASPNLNFNVPGPVPSWAHLLMGREELQHRLRQAGVDGTTSDYVLHQIYDSAAINRLHFEDYEAAIAASEFICSTVEPWWPRPVPPDVLARLEDRFPGYRRFDAYGIRIRARRASGTQTHDGERSVLICGSGRSGTSALAGMFDAQRYFKGDNLFPPTISNPKGYFENFAINDVNESILVRSAVAHLGAEVAAGLLASQRRGQLWLARWPTAMPVVRDEAMTQAIRRIVRQRPFCLKDPRFSVTAPVWLDELTDALVVCVFRPPAVTAASILRACAAEPYLRSFRISVDDAFAVWRQQYRRVLQLYRARPDVLFVRFADLFDDARLGRLEAHLGTALARGFVERSLDRTETNLQPDPRCTAQFELLNAISNADFGCDRDQVLPWVEAFERAHPLQDAAVPEAWRLIPDP